MKLLYIADDGTQFSSKTECSDYEFKQYLSNFISNKRGVKYVLDNPDCTVKELVEYLKPLTYNIPWNEIVSSINYVAMDSNGKWYGYITKPCVGELSDKWITDYLFESVDIGFIHPDWKTSLFERP